MCPIRNTTKREKLIESHIKEETRSNLKNNNSILLFSVWVSGCAASTKHSQINVAIGFYINKLQNLFINICL